ncbi:cytochrome P450 family protein [Streptomyces sp. NPDC002536]
MSDRTGRTDRTPHRLDPAGTRRHEDDAGLRARGAAVPVVLPGDVPAVAVTRHEELKEFLADPDVAKGACHFTALREGAIPDGWPLTIFATLEGMTTADGIDHRRLRGIVTKVFTPARIEGLRPRVERLTAELLDGLGAAADASGVVDLRHHFALPLPMSVIGELLGVPPGMRGELRRFSYAIARTTATPEESTATNLGMAEALGRLAALRRAEPGDDLTSALVAAHDEDGSALDDRELTATLLTLVVAGHETTLALITNAVRALCTHPDQLELVRSGKAGWADAVEETLRYDAPVGLFPFRYPLRDLPVGGTVVPRGTPVLAAYASAGRDERAYGPDADRFDVTRRPAGRLLSFGHGAHYCIGAPLARLEATVALEALFARHPDLALAVPDHELPRLPSFISNSTEVLPVRLFRAP